MGILSKKEEADWGLEQRQQQSLCIWPAICICTLWARSVAVSSVSNGGKEVRLGSVSASKSPQWENSMPSTHRVLFPSSLCILTHACARIHTHTHKYVDKYYRNNSQSKVYAQLPLVSLLEILAAHPHSTSVKQTPRPHHSLSVNPHTLLLVIFCQLDPNYGHLRKGTLKWEITSITLACDLVYGHFLEKRLTWKSPVYYGQCHQSIPSWVVQKES